MRNIDRSLREITEIRSMMEQASKFISLSGMSGVNAGCIALAGAWVAQWVLSGGVVTDGPNRSKDVAWILSLTGLLVLVLAVGGSVVLSARIARRRGLPIWDQTAKNLLGGLAFPLGTGGCFCLLLLYHGIYFLLPATMLVFYGIGLVNAGKYTLGEIRVLGGLEVFVGLVAGCWPATGVLAWAAGFGALHVLYGIVMHVKYKQ